jgi:hypothetical protein
LLELFGTLHARQLDLFFLNFSEIILLLKVNYAEKIFTKTKTSRLNMVVDHVMCPIQAVFRQGRYILDGVVNLLEIVHELHRKKMNGVILKIDFEKVYDKVK